MGNSGNDDWIAWAVSAAAGVIGLVAAAVLGQPQTQAQPQGQPNVTFNHGTNNPTPAPVKKPGCGCGK
jgi:hypothetical protein